MKEFILTSLFLFFLHSCVTRQDEVHQLHFSENGAFRILHFTDIHYQCDDPQSDSSLILIKEAIAEEKPDLVVLTGDVVYSPNTMEAWLRVGKVLGEGKVPWAVVLGNHDIEFELSGEEIMEVISTLPWSVCLNGAEDLSGNGNYIIELCGPDSDKPKALLYFLDSHSRSKDENKYGYYDWIKADQVNWYRENSLRYTIKNNDAPLPALAFFHIPLPEYKEIAEKTGTTGTFGENVCSPEINSGMFLAMLECGDIMGTFAGHDHVNNFIGINRGLCLAYGQATGSRSYGDIGKGVRVIDLKEGERGFTTWTVQYYDCIPEEGYWNKISNRTKENYTVYPDSFIIKQ